MGKKWALPTPIRSLIPKTDYAIFDLTRVLKRMGLLELMSIPWDITERSYLKDFVLNAPAVQIFGKEVRGRPERWTIEFVAAAFKCPAGGLDFVSRKPEYSNSYFGGKRNSKHGWNISQCKSTRLQLLLKFLMPILHPRKPTYAPVTLLNSVIAAWKKTEEVNWAHILRETLLKEYENLKPNCPTYLQNYLAQLYAHGNCLYPDERMERETLREALGASPDLEEAEESAEGEDPEDEDQSTPEKQQAATEENHLNEQPEESREPVDTYSVTSLDAPAQDLLRLAGSRRHSTVAPPDSVTPLSKLRSLNNSDDRVTNRRSTRSTTAKMRVDHPSWDPNYTPLPPGQEDPMEEDYRPETVDQSCCPNAEEMAHDVDIIEDNTVGPGATRNVECQSAPSCRSYSTVSLSKEEPPVETISELHTSRPKKRKFFVESPSEDFGIVRNSTPGCFEGQQQLIQQETLLKELSCLLQCTTAEIVPRVRCLLQHVETINRKAQDLFFSSLPTPTALDPSVVRPTNMSQDGVRRSCMV